MKTLSCIPSVNMTIIKKPDSNCYELIKLISDNEGEVIFEGTPLQINTKLLLLDIQNDPIYDLWHLPETMLSFEQQLNGLKYTS